MNLSFVPLSRASNLAEPHPILLATHQFSSLQFSPEKPDGPGIGGEEPSLGQQKRREDFAVWREMQEALQIFSRYISHDHRRERFCADAARACLDKGGKMLIAGEGSSILFPGKFVQRLAVKYALPVSIDVMSSDDACQLHAAALTRHCIILSNSGRSREPNKFKEIVNNFGHTQPSIITATPDSPITQDVSAPHLHVLDCGKERAVAATKSVIEQALLLLYAVTQCDDRIEIAPELLLNTMRAMEAALDRAPQAEAVSLLAQARQVYVFGPEDGCAAEIALKLPELTGIQSLYFGGALGIHGPLQAYDSQARQPIIVLRPSVDFIRSLAEKEPNAPMIVIGAQEVLDAAPQGAIKIPLSMESKGLFEKDFAAFEALAYCWRLFVDVGVSIGRDLDNPTKLSKVATESKR
jgi:glucosamine--fructose-6-phosphate aminotransferase (isomerizing)